MKFSTALVACVSTASFGLCHGIHGARAPPAGGPPAGGPPAGFPAGGHGFFGKCLKPADKDALVAAYVRLIAAYKPEDADKYLTDSFVEYSDSINSLAGIPLGSPTFPSKAAFKAAQTVNPSFALEVKGTPTVACTTISGVLGKGNPVRGLSILETVKEGEDWKISRLDTEFNSIAWLLDIGGSVTFPQHS